LNWLTSEKLSKWLFSQADSQSTLHQWKTEGDSKQKSISTAFPPCTKSSQQNNGMEQHKNHMSTTVQDIQHSQVHQEQPGLKAVGVYDITCKCTTVYMVRQVTWVKKAWMTPPPPPLSLLAL
jgi:hypothetical protein